MRLMLQYRREYELARKLNSLNKWQEANKYNQPPSALDYDNMVTNNPQTAEILVFDGNGTARTQIQGG